MTISARLSVIARKLSLKNWLTKPAASPLGEQSKTRLRRASINSARSPEPVEGLRRTECVYILLAMTIVVLSPSPSYAYSDRDNTDIYTKQSQYSPGWVMDSVYNPKAEAGMKDSVDKLNAAENTQAIKQKNTDNPDATAESKLPLKKKKSASQASQTKNINEIRDLKLPDNVVLALRAIDPADMAGWRAEAIAKGEQTVKFGMNGQTITYWTEDAGVFYRINNKDGSLYGADKNILGTSSSLPADVLKGEGWNQDDVNNSYSYINYLGDGGSISTVRVTTYHYTFEDGVYNATILIGMIAMTPDNRSELNYNRFDALRASYDFNSGRYSLDQGAIRYMRGSDGSYSLVAVPGEHSVDTGYVYTAPTITQSVTFTPTLNNYTRYDPYDYYNYITSYNKNNGTSPMLSSEKNKEDASSFDGSINKDKLLKPELKNYYNDIYDYKIESTSLLDGLFADPLSLKNDKTIELEDLILILDNKESKTKIEENILIVARAIEENMAYLDQKTIKDFTEVIRIVQAIEDMKSMISELDFANIAKSLTKLVEDQRGFYNDYLSKTESIYKNIEAILGIDISKDTLPEEYISITKSNILARRKMAVDLTLERLKNIEENALKPNEKEAVRVYNDILGPIREEYSTKLRMAITTFSWSIKDILKDEKEPSIQNGKSDFKALFVLDYDNSPAGLSRKSNP